MLRRLRVGTQAAGHGKVRDCLEFGAAPPQLAPTPTAPPPWRPGTGLDCLTLNVWSPDVGTAGLPVMEWIYGGLWKLGSSSMPQYDAATLTGSGVVVVTFNYRVGFEASDTCPGPRTTMSCATSSPPWNRCETTSPRSAAPPPT
ncbi:carboxylesterase family protein [Nonomuraea sp. NPDC050691]|uniref:carboxylesterase family protein n=1 Tax=Nonomuraea sp. NPDC050691 TaxID=3155661 RepID=UPI0033DD6F01